MMNYYISLYEVTPETGGIFSALNDFSVPWKDDIDPDLLDLQYYGNVSGEKTISPLVYKNLDENGKLTESKQALIASMIFKLYGANWIKEWATLAEQYDPIANYDMTEIMEDDETVIEYGKTEDTTTGNTHTKTGTETDTPDVTITTEDSIYGFNSSSASNSNKRVEDPSGTNETEYDLSETDNGSVGLEQGGSDTHTRNYTLTRKGNIGVTTSQQLLQAERDLWMWNYFNDVVFPDVDRVMTIPLYAESTGYSGSSGGVTPTGTIYITENGNRIDVASFAYANVNVPNSYSAADEGKVVSDGALVAQTERAITENGTYDTTENNQAIVNVPNSYSAADEGKVVSNGALVAQTERTITENGTYDTTENNSVIVNTPSSVLYGTEEPTASVGSNGAIYLQTTPFGAKNVAGQYIDTGYSGNNNSKYVIDFRFDKEQSSNWVCPFGGRPHPSNVVSASLLSLAINNGNYSKSSVQWGSDIAIDTGWDGATRLQGKNIHAEISAGLAKMSVNGDKLPDKTWTPTAVTDTSHIGLFAALANNAYQSWSFMDEMVLYRFKIYESGLLVHDFVPTIDQNEVVCIKDNVSGEYKYPNSGTLVGVQENDNIFAAYLKVNGAWQALIGSDIDDVDH